MTKLEVDFFRYCCRQADYEKSLMTVYTITDLDQQSDGFSLLVTIINWNVRIYFQKHITLMILDYAFKNSISKSELLTIANRWLNEGLLEKNIWCNEGSSYRYNFCFGKIGKYISKYYDICPMRVINKLNITNTDNLPWSKPSYEYFKASVSNLERKCFRFFVRNCVKKKSRYDENGFWIKIDDFDKLYKNWTGRTHHTVCSKNLTKKFIHKWKNLGIYSTEQEKALYKKERVNNYSVIKLSEDNKAHVRYIRILPGNIYKELIKEYTDSFDANE